jgi:hypothetical protein
MKKIVRLTESDLARIVKRVIQEQEEEIFATHPVQIEYGQQKWIDKSDKYMQDSDIEFSDVKEFGPEDYDSFMEYINNCDTLWCLKTKRFYDMYAKMGNIKVGKGTRR